MYQGRLLAKDRFIIQVVFSKLVFSYTVLNRAGQREGKDGLNYAC